jgi:cytochrome P450
MLSSKLGVVFENPRDRLDLDSLPGPASIPWVAHYAATARFLADQVGFLDGLAKGGHGDVVIFARGMRGGVNMLPTGDPPAAVFLTGPRFMQQVLQNHATYPETLMARLSERWGGAARLVANGLTWLHGDAHKQRRRLIAPLYHAKHVQNYNGLIASITGRALDRFKPGQTVRVMEEAAQVLIDFQDQAIFGISGPAAESARLRERFAKMFDDVANPMMHAWPFKLPGTPLQRALKEGDKLAADLSALIEEKRAAGPGARDVLSMLLDSQDEQGNKLTSEEVLAELGLLFVAGWISTRAVIAWTSFLIAQHPSVAADLHDELFSKLHGDAPSAEQLKDLPLLDAVVKESLRLLPPAPMISRASHEAVEIGGYKLPAWTELHLSIYHTHRQPDLYPEPQRFLPERWGSVQPGPYSYLPFGLGSRTCPGMALANLEVRLFIAMLMQRYRLEVPEGATIKRSGFGIMVPNRGMELRVRKQDREFTRSRATVRGNIHTMVDLSH